MKKTLQNFIKKNDQMPLAAVLRNITPEEAVPVSDVLVENGFTVLEVTLPSPDSFETLKRIKEKHGDKIVLAAGTVLKPSEVSEVKAVGCDLVVSPNTNPDVIKETIKQDLVSVAGCQTPTEMFVGINAGTDIVKIFPPISVAYFNAMKSIAPKDTQFWPTGAMVENVADFFGAGALIMGTSPKLYMAGREVAQVGDYAKALTQAVRDYRS